MTRKAVAVLLAIAVVLAFTLPAFADETVKGKIEALDKDGKKITISGTEYSMSEEGKIEALDKDGKKITISGTEYSMSEEAAQVEVTVGDEVEATVDGGMVKTLTKM